MKTEPRRIYYDHEPAYLSRRAKGHSGWSTTQNDGAYDRFNEFLADGRFPAPGTALDTGCGGGELCIRLAVLGWRAIGFDFAETAVLLATQNAQCSNSTAQFVRADCVEPWPFPNDFFNLILDNHVMHCLLEPNHRNAYLANAQRVLKPNGVLFSTNMSAEGALNYARYNIDPESRIDANRTRYWTTKAEALDEFNRAGLRVVQCHLHNPPNDDESGGELVVVAMYPR